MDTYRLWQMEMPGLLAESDTGADEPGYDGLATGLWRRISRVAHADLQEKYPAEYDLASHVAGYVETQGMGRAYNPSCGVVVEARQTAYGFSYAVLCDRGTDAGRCASCPHGRPRWLATVICDGFTFNVVARDNGG